MAEQQGGEAVSVLGVVEAALTAGNGGRGGDAPAADSHLISMSATRHLHCLARGRDPADTTLTSTCV